jgi:hypothetical protein
MGVESDVERVVEKGAARREARDVVSGVASGAVRGVENGEVSVLDNSDEEKALANLNVPALELRVYVVMKREKQVGMRD